MHPRQWSWYIRTAERLLDAAEYAWRVIAVDQYGARLASDDPAVTVRTLTVDNGNVDSPAALYGLVKEGRNQRACSLQGGRRAGMFSDTDADEEPLVKVSRA